jgi:multiple sugar transport system substrate-binding protein/raffinose/stachyose/melibiose transport system substrate-binding protein
LDKAFPAALSSSAAAYGGKRYLLPITQHAVGFFYNKNLFERVGIGVPKDWPSFIAACAALKKAGITPIALGAESKWPAQFWFDYLLLRTAGHEYRERLMAGTASWTDGEVRTAFALWRDLVAAGYFNEAPETVSWDTGASRMVVEGRAAMTLMGTWILGVWNGFGLDWKDDRDYGFFPFPSVSSGVPACIVGPVDGVVVPKRALDPEGAKRVIAFLSGIAAQEAMSRGSGALAPNAAVPASAYSVTQLRVREAIAESAAWAFNYDLATPPTASDIGLSLFIDFLRFPEEYAELLEAAQKRFQAFFSAGGG